MKYEVTIVMVLTLSGCGGNGNGVFGGGGSGLLGGLRSSPSAVPASTPTAEIDPMDSGVVVPDPDARTVEEFDTTSAEDRAAAVVDRPADRTDGRLGITISSIGDPTEPGFWIKTPLVTEPAAGRIFYETSGRSVQVQLIPSGGPAGGGSQVSLAAMRLLDAPLTGLPELVVYQN